MSNIKVSIIVPVYNSDQYIKNTIENILNQSLHNIELILINDGSTDNSKHILDEFAIIDSRVKVIHQENKGVSCARNKGISTASGEYIGFVDSDDFIDSDMYETMYNKAISSNSDIVCCGFIEEDATGKVFRTYDYPLVNSILENKEIKSKFAELLNTKLEILGGSPMWNKIFKKSFINQHNISIDENITVGEDLCFNIKAFYNAHIVSGVDKQFYHYMNVNPNSIMSKLDDNKFRKFIDGRIWILKTLEKYNLNSKEYTESEYSKNFANLIQIADYRLTNTSNFSEKYKKVSKILKSEEVKNSLSLSNNKYLSKNLQILKKCIQLHLNFIVFFIMYMRAIKKSKA